MTDVLDAVRRADRLPRNAWSESAEGRAAHDRVFARLPDPVPRSRSPRRTRPVPALVAAVLTVTLVVATAALLIDRRSENSSVAGMPSRRQMAGGTWSVRRDVALSGMSDVDAVRGGRRLYVVGRRDDDVVGVVAYDPGERDWTVLPDSPLRTVRGFPNHAIAWSGRELFVIVTYPVVESRPMMAAYDPREKQWRVLPSSPLPSYSGGLDSANAGGRWLLTGVASAGTPGAVFGFRTGRWSPVSSPDLIGDEEFGVTRHGRLLAVSKPFPGRPSAVASAPPYETWETMKGADVPHSSPVAVVLVDGSPHLVSREQGGWMHVATFDDGWQDEPATVRMRRSSPDATAVVAAAGGLFVGAKERVSWFDAAGADWAKLPPAPRDVEVVAWTGDQLLALTRGRGLATYTPGR